jgi:hypothetical protein
MDETLAEGADRIALFTLEAVNFERERPTGYRLSGAGAVSSDDPTQALRWLHSLPKPVACRGHANGQVLEIVCEPVLGNRGLEPYLDRQRRKIANSDGAIGGAFKAHGPDRREGKLIELQSGTGSMIASFEDVLAWIRDYLVLGDMILAGDPVAEGLPSPSPGIVW